MSRLSESYTKKNNEVEVEVKVKAVTAKALLVHFGGEMEVWVPKSQITDWSGSEELDVNVTGIFVPEWLAIEKGMV